VSKTNTYFSSKFHPQIIKKIGSGAYGHVYKVSDRKTKKIKALKKNFDAFNNSTDAQRTYR
jgi:mitogen-activated protein kinase 15